MSSHELQPLEWQERWEPASMPGRGGVEVVLSQCSSGVLLPYPLPSSSLLSWLPPQPCQGTPSSHSTPVNHLHPGSLLTARLGFLQSLVLWHHMGQLWDVWAVGSTVGFSDQRVCAFPLQEGFCPGHAQACPHDRPETQKCMLKSKEPSHQGVCPL